MSIDRKDIKTQAKALLKETKPSPILVGLAFAVIMAVMAALTVGVTIPLKSMKEYMTVLSSGDMEAAMEFAQNYTPSTASNLLSLAIKLLTLIISGGFSIYSLHLVRHEESSVGNLMDGFTIPLQLLILGIITDILVSLWSMLFIIPGFIALYSYSQSVYLTIDNPEKRSMECILRSKIMMRGHKMELFLLDLSFIGWFALAVLFPPVFIYVLPFYQTSRALYYEELRALPIILDEPPTNL